jgi:predicted transcriptional regulator
MINVGDCLNKIKVGEVMASRLVTVSSHSNMGEAADLLCEKRISGVPVVDDRGTCVGILSASDFVHSKAEEAEAGHDYESALSRPHFSFDDSSGHDLVRHHMTPRVKTVNIDCSVLDAARCLCDNHIHRLLVVNKENQPVGILTTLDLISTFVKAVET